MAKKKITVLAEELLTGSLQEEGLELYHSEFVKEGKDWFLRIYIDKPEGEGYIGTEDCEKVSRFLSEKLDEADPVGAELLPGGFFAGHGSGTGQTGTLPEISGQ